MTREQQRRKENIAAGLRYDGKPRVLKRWPELHGKSNREQSNFHTRKWRQSFKARGLTVYGTQRKNYQWPELAGLTGYDRAKRRAAICQKRYRAAKKITKPEIQVTVQLALPPKITTLRSRAWRDADENNRVLLAEIQSAINAINETFDQLNPMAKANCIQLAHSLSAIRNRIL